MSEFVDDRALRQTVFVRTEHDMVRTQQINHADNFTGITIEPTPTEGSA